MARRFTYGGPSDDLRRLRSRYGPGTLMDKTYTSLPARNVANTETGYKLIETGRIAATVTP